jgi:hypothetical protein
VTVWIEAPGDTGATDEYAELHLQEPRRDIMSVLFCYILFHCSNVPLLARFLHDHDSVESRFALS